MIDRNITAVLIAIGSFTIWGLFPLYWKQIDHINALEILAFRGVFSVLFAGIFIAMAKEGHALKQIISSKKTVLALLASGTVVAANWGIYIWAVNAGNIVETSLGYYINPLLNVFASAIIFKATMNKIQKLSIVLVCIGVGYMLVGYGSIPFVGLSLAVSFCMYGVIRKMVSVTTFSGLFVEAFFISIPSLTYLTYLFITGTGTYLHASNIDIVYIVFSGLATTVPLAGFAYAAKTLPLSTIGIVQYLTPTISFFLGIFLYNETFTTTHFITFSFIWVAVIIYTVDGVVTYRKSHK